MPSIVTLPSNLQWVGLAKETTYGTPVAAPTVWIPVDGSSTKYKPNINPLVDAAYRGQMSGEFQQLQGMRHDTLDYKSYLYLDSVYQHFLAVLGRPDQLSGAADPYTHKTALENGVDNAGAQPPSFTLFYYEGSKCFQIPGCVPATVKLTVKVDELATIDVSWMGLPATQMTTAPANTPSTSKPIPSWNSTISIGGTALSTYSALELEFKRDTAEVPTINGTQTPVAIFAGTFTVAGTLTAVYQGGGTDVNLADFLVNTQPALSVKCSPVGDAVHYLLVQCSTVAYDGVDPAGTNKWMEIQSTIKAIANATDALDSRTSPAQVQLLSPVSTAY